MFERSQVNSKTIGKSSKAFCITWIRYLRYLSLEELYCLPPSICHLKRTVWVNRPSTSFTQVILEKFAMEHRGASNLQKMVNELPLHSHSTYSFTSFTGFAVQSVPCSVPIDPDNPVDPEWISRFSKVLLFVQFEKRYATAGNVRRVKRFCTVRYVRTYSYFSGNVEDACERKIIPYL